MYYRLSVFIFKSILKTNKQTSDKSKDEKKKNIHLTKLSQKRINK